MSTNTDLQTIFLEMAAVLEITGANGFRVNAHRRGARAMDDMTVDVATIADDPAALQAIDGIGKGLAAKISEFIERGEVQEHQSLLASLPQGLLGLLDVSGLGPKTIKMLWEQADVVDLATLKRAIDAGRLNGLPRMGPKTIANIRDSVAFLERAGDRLLLGTAYPLATALVTWLKEDAAVSEAMYAGSLRRCQETIGDIDLLGVSSDPEATMTRFTQMKGVIKVLVSGPTKSSVRLDVGVQVDLRLVPAAQCGAALLYFTGSKEHNVRLRERAIAASMRLNEYGLFPDDGEDAPPQTRGVPPVAAETERAIYAALDLPMIPPEIREDRGEFDGPLPKLIELDEIVSDLHMHTIASDGHSTIMEMAEAARARGLAVIAITDHSVSQPQANGLDAERMWAHLEAIRSVNETIEGITVLAGAEVDILPDGRLDYDDDLLAAMDVVVASPHAALRQDPAEATARLVAAIEHPSVNIIGHPTGRLIRTRRGLEPDMETVVHAAREHGTALEINANPARLDLRDRHVHAAVEGGCMISINTDAHAPEQLDLRCYGVATGRRGWLTAAGCINCFDEATLRTFLGCS
jgi:DNA polymerase (family 10)